jgi:hypothetical protein
MRSVVFAVLCLVLASCTTTQKAAGDCAAGGTIAKTKAVMALGPDKGVLAQ